MVNAKTIIQLGTKTYQRPMLWVVELEEESIICASDADEDTDGDSRYLGENPDAGDQFVDD